MIKGLEKIALKPWRMKSPQGFVFSTISGWLMEQGA
jgi:hypothetical protein